MSDLTRFDVEDKGAMHEHVEGDYVRFEDYEQLQKERDELEATVRKLETLIDKNNCLIQHSCDQVCASFLQYSKYRHAPNCPTEFFIEIGGNKSE